MLASLFFFSISFFHGNYIGGDKLSQRVVGDIIVFIFGSWIYWWGGKVEKKLDQGLITW